MQAPPVGAVVHEELVVPRIWRMGPSVPYGKPESGCRASGGFFANGPTARARLAWRGHIYYDTVRRNELTWRRLRGTTANQHGDHAGAQHDRGRRVGS